MALQRPTPFDMRLDPHDEIWKTHQTILELPFEALAQPLTIGLPVGHHPGSFGFIRQHHRHEGIDLYVPSGTPVYAMTEGVIKRIEWFTGSMAQSPWWHDTQSVYIEGEEGCFNYGEILVHPQLRTEMDVQAGKLLGWVTPVLKINKGRPMSMLHLECYEKGSLVSAVWQVDQPQPLDLKDPTPYLLTLAQPLS